MSKIRLGELKDLSATAARLVAGGLSAHAAADKAKLLANSAAVANKAGLADDSAVSVLYVPGRIEVLGKHTDYAGGRSLLATPEKGFVVIVAPRADSTVRLIPAGGAQIAEFQINPDISPVMGHWSNYPMTVTRRIARNFSGPLRGADIVFQSDLPLAAGMSSSSALVIVSFLALSAANNLSDRPEYKQNIHNVEDLAGYLGTCENGQTFGSLAGDKGVGTFGGSEDHTAILTCKSGTLNQYSYCPVRFEKNVPVPAGYVFAIGASGVVAEKTGDAREKYNRASLLCRAAIETWRQATGRNDAHLAAAVASTPDAVHNMREILAKTNHPHFSGVDMLRRFEHFYGESEQIIPAASEAMARGDMAEFGRQVDRSQADSERLLLNQIPETAFLAQSARECGAVAASAFGAGFGGAVWALVQRDRADKMLKDWAGRYGKTFPAPAKHAVYFLTNPGPAAFELT